MKLKAGQELILEDGSVIETEKGDSLEEGSNFDPTQIVFWDNEQTVMKPSRDDIEKILSAIGKDPSKIHISYSNGNEEAVCFSSIDGGALGGKKYVLYSPSNSKFSISLDRIIKVIPMRDSYETKLRFVGNELTFLVTF